MRALSLIPSAVAVMLAGAAPAAPAGAEAELIRLEQAYARALITRDMAFLRSYYAPDYRGGNWMGFQTRATILQKIRDSRYTVRSMELRDMTVRVLGDIAIVQGVDEEVTSMRGRDTSGRWAFTDVFARRGGRWVAIATHTSRINPSSP